MKPINPKVAAGGGAGLSFGVIVAQIWEAVFGVPMDPELAVAVATLLGAFVGWVVKDKGPEA